MNAERLHAVARQVVQDIRATGSPSMLRGLHAALQSQVSSPQEPSHQQEVAAIRERLRDALSTAASNAFPATWSETIDSLGVGQLLGARLLVTVDEIFDRNQITPAVAAEEIDRLAGNLERVQATLEQLVSNLTTFNVGAEELEDEQAEVSILIPRSEVDNELLKLGNEFAQLSRILGPFSELATGQRSPITVSSVASSDFGLFLTVDPMTAAVVAQAVATIISTYRNILDIRRLRDEMREKGVSDSELAPVDQHANSRMDEANRDLADTLVVSSRATIDQGRRNELKTEIRLSLNAISNRIDHGYNIDVRASAPAPSEDGNDSEATVALRTIVEISPGLKYLNRTGRPILELPEGNGPDSTQNEAR